MIYKFPKNFYWGAATSAHQVEGNNHNDWSEWESSEGRFKELKNRGLNPENFISGKACNSYNRFEEDFDIAKQLGHNAHRFSIEWSRVEPEEGKFNEKEIEHYRKVIQALKKRNLEPFVTLWHWTVPIWFQNNGGWLAKKSVQNFSRFVSKIAEIFGDEIQFWCVLNEPEVFTAYGYVIGIRPPQEKNIWKAIIIFNRLIAAHREAYRILHEKSNRGCYVGIAKHDKFFTPADNSFKNKIFTFIAKFFWNKLFIKKIKDYQDFIGLNYYNKDTVDFGWKKFRQGLYNLEESAEGFYDVLTNLSKYKKPIYVLENGLDNPNDEKRPRFIKEHISAMAKAIQNGTEVRGYMHWSLLDNFEWENAYGPRFGLVEVDFKTLKRKIRPSAWEYKKIIESNTLSS